MKSFVPLSIFAVVAVASMMWSASITPVYAAKKVFDEDINTPVSGVTSLCGGTNFSGVIKGHMTTWDNNHYKYHVTMMMELTDPITGERVGIQAATDNGQGDLVDFPISGQSNTVVTCVGDGSTFNSHSGYTMHQDGTVTLHGP